MKTNKHQTYKVSFGDLKERYSFPDAIDDEIRKRINRVNRTNSIPRKALERRSLEMQTAYIEILKLEKEDTKKLESIVAEHCKVYKLYGAYSDEYKKQDERFNNYCRLVGLATYEYDYYDWKYTTKFFVPPHAIIDVIMAYQFN